MKKLKMKNPSYLFSIIEGEKKELIEYSKLVQMG